MTNTNNVVVTGDDAEALARVIATALAAAGYPVQHIGYHTAMMVDIAKLGSLREYPRGTTVRVA